MKYNNIIYTNITYCNTKQYDIKPNNMLNNI